MIQQPSALIGLTFIGLERRFLVRAAAKKGDEILADVLKLVVHNLFKLELRESVNQERPKKD